MGSNNFAKLPTAIYGVVMLLSSVAYLLLQNTIIAEQGPDSTLRKAIGGDVKGTLSMTLYACAIGLAFLNRWLALGIYLLVALMWLIPDSRIESKLR